MPKNWIAPIHALALAAAAGLILAGCAASPTQEQSPAGVEERKPGEGGPETRGAKPGQVPTIDLTSKKQAASPLTDPNNILSKRSIYYDFDQYDVKDEYRPLVEAHAKYLRDHPDVKVLIQGNTDERGSREYNVGLGQRRSDGVKKMLLLLGVKESQIEAVSLGEEKPKDPGHDEQAWSQNRRCDILYPGEY
ncbi:MAG TPA: peptidoglycan-associated lipoprotein Pal [Burkholderiales bacterium]|nr:peptidoglycan-associated lipoprotein Pal [Burkholderiales bacterium]